MAKISTDKPMRDLEVLVVSRAVDDGDIYSSALIAALPDQPAGRSNVHKLSDALLRTRNTVSQKVHDISGSVKSSASHVAEDVKMKAAQVSDSVKKGVDTVNSNVKANPYLYAAGAVALGFAIGRVFMMYRERSEKLSQADYRTSRHDSALHTGVHVRGDVSYAGGSGA